jgi:hypothetical protein
LGFYFVEKPLRGESMKQKIPGMSYIMQNGGNDAKINRIPPLYNPFGMKMLANITRRGIRVLVQTIRQMNGSQNGEKYEIENYQNAFGINVDFYLVGVLFTTRVCCILLW